MDTEPKTRDANAAQSRGRIVGLAVAAVLILLGWFLIQELGSASRLQDCVMSGRTNCAPIEVPADKS